MFSLSATDFLFLIEYLKGSGKNLTENAFNNVKFCKDWIVFCCPFHNENNPSFGISLKGGGFNCFSCGMHGNIIDFVSLLGVCGKDEAEIFLYENFDCERNSRSSVLSLKQKLSSLSEKNSRKVNISEHFLKCIGIKHNYFYKRGLSDRSIKKYELGFDRLTNCVIFPVRDETGSIAFFQRRSVTGKLFINDSGADKTQVLYGLYYLLNSGRVYHSVAITESIIDAISLYEVGIPAVSIMGRSISKRQVELLRLLLPETVILFFDNDEAGKTAVLDAKKLLKKEGYTLKVPIYPNGYKDANNLLLANRLFSVTYKIII